MQADVVSPGTPDLPRYSCQSKNTEAQQHHGHGFRNAHAGPISVDNETVVGAAAFVVASIVRTPATIRIALRKILASISTVSSASETVRCVSTNKHHRNHNTQQHQPHYVPPVLGPLFPEERSAFCINYIPGVACRQSPNGLFRIGRTA
jgi:hypothetical protein